MMVNVIFSFLLGTLPGIDNLAHVGGFVTGMFAGFLLLPKIYFGVWDRRIKQIFMFLAIPLLAGFTYVFLVSFWNGENQCTWCKYFNCIPGM
jgi:Rhomboid family